jgi:biopolymer transport protein ExbB/TolQ
MGFTVVWFAFIYFFQAAPGKPPGEFTLGETIANLFYKHFTVSFANTLFFFWGAAICYLKLLKLKHQRRAMLLDVLPMDLGNEISAKNVGTFIDHVYGLPVQLRDSLMVNRIRKALEFFEVRQNVADVSTLMSSQSAIDGARITGSYILVRAFLWAIPLLGFIGTVVGLSHAISGMSFSNVEDVNKIVSSINNVTNGLGTAFDATLLGLVFAVLLNFPINSLAKHEEEALNDIDAFCNEVLLPRLDDGAAKQSKALNSTSDLRVMAETLGRALTSSQKEFLTDLNALSSRMLSYANDLESRNEQYQQAALQYLGQQMNALDKRAEEHLDSVREKQDAVMAAFSESMLKMQQSSKELHESLNQDQKAALLQFTEKLGSVASSVEASLGGALQQTQRTVSGFVESVSKLEEPAKSLGQIIKSTQEEANRQLREGVRTMAARAEEALSASLHQTGQTIAGLESGVRNLHSALEQHFSQSLNRLEKASENLHQSLARDQKQALTQVTEKLEKVAATVETSLTASLQQTQRTVASFAESVAKLEEPAQSLHQSLKSAQDETHRQLSDGVRSMLASIESATNASLQQTQHAVSGIEASMRALHATLEQNLSQSLARLEQAGRASQENLLREQTTALQNLTQSTQSASSSLGSSLHASVDLTQKTIGTLEATVRDLHHTLAQSFSQSLSTLEHSAKHLQESMARDQAATLQQLAANAQAATSSLGSSLSTTVALTQNTLANIESGVRALQQSLEQIAGNSSAPQQPKKKWWFGGQ